MVLSRREVEYQIRSYGQLEPYAVSSLCCQLEKINAETVGYYYLFEGNRNKGAEQRRRMNHKYAEKL